MEQLIAEKGVILTVDEVNGFLNQLDEEDEFDDIELVPIALAVFAGGARNHQSNVAKRTCMTSHGGVSLACVRCASGISVGSLSLKLKSLIDPSPDGLDE